MKLHKTIMCLQSLLFILASVYGSQEKLLFYTNEFLKEIDLDTGVVKTLTTQNDYAFSMAYDHEGRYMYSPRYSRDIVRFPYPTNQTVMLETVVSATNPVGTAFDSVNRHLYWTEHNPGNRIMRCNPDGSNATVLLNEMSPAALTLDIQNRWIYYGQQTFPSKIFRINFDGTDKEVIVQNLTTYVFGIGIDIDVKRLFWMEYSTGDLRSAWLNGSVVKTTISTNVTSRSWDIDMDDDFIFYTSSNKIMKIKKSLGYTPTVVHTDTYQIYGIVLYKQYGKSCDEK